MTSSQIVVICVWLRAAASLAGFTANALLARLYAMEIAICIRRNLNGAELLVIRNRLRGANLRTYGLVVFGFTAFVNLHAVRWDDLTPRWPRAIEELLLLSLIARDWIVIVRQWLEREELARLGTIELRKGGE